MNQPGFNEMSQGFWTLLTCALCFHVFFPFSVWHFQKGWLLRFSFRRGDCLGFLCLTYLCSCNQSLHVVCFVLIHTVVGEHLTFPTAVACCICKHHGFHGCLISRPKEKNPKKCILLGFVCFVVTMSVIKNKKNNNNNNISYTCIPRGGNWSKTPWNCRIVYLLQDDYITMYLFISYWYSL